MKGVNLLMYWLLSLPCVHSSSHHFSFFSDFWVFLSSSMASTDGLSPSSRQSRSHVVVLTIPDDALEDVGHILERFSFHRGWASHISSFVDQESAIHAAERCISFSLQQSSSPSAQQVQLPFRYPITEREISLLIPDRVDARSGVVNPSSRLSNDVMSGPAQLTVRDRLQLRRMASQR